MLKKSLLLYTRYEIPTKKNQAQVLRNDAVFRRGKARENSTDFPLSLFAPLLSRPTEPLVTVYVEQKKM